MAPVLVRPVVSGSGVLGSVGASVGVPSTAVEPDVGFGGLVVNDDVVIEDLVVDDECGSDVVDEDPVVGRGDVVSEFVGGVVPGGLDEVPSRPVSPGGGDPMEVGSLRVAGDAVSDTDVSSNTKLVMPSTDVSTVVPRDDAVPQPYW